MRVRYVILIIASCSIFSMACDKNKTLFDEPFPCEDGMADGKYPCENVGMYAHIPLTEFDTERLNDIWGWTDRQTGKEYALVGLYNGVSFVDVSNPKTPVIVGSLPETSFSAKRLNLETADFEICEFGIGSTPEAKSLTEGSVWRDLKVYDDHLFIVSDAQSHGMQVFDLSALREFEGTPLTFSEDAIYTKISNAHNIVINEESGFAYAVGATNSVNEEFVNDCNEGGLHMIDISNPKRLFLQVAIEIPTLLVAVLVQLIFTMLSVYSMPVLMPIIRAQKSVLMLPSAPLISQMFLINPILYTLGLQQIPMCSTHTKDGLRKIKPILL